MGIRRVAEERMGSFGYVVTLLLIGLMAGLILFASWLAGAMEVGLIILGIIFTVLVLVRVQIGLLVMAALVFWEAQTALAETFTMVKAAGIIVAFFAIPQILFRRGPRTPGFIIAALLLASWCLVPLVANLGVTTALQTASLVSNIVFAYLLVWFCSTPTAMRALLWVMVLSATGEAVLGLVLYVTPGAMPHYIRLTTTEALNINTYVRLMFIAVFVTPILIFHTQSRFLRLALIGSIGAGVTAMLLTLSRAALIGAALGGLVFFVSLKGIRLRAKIAIVVVGALALGSALYATAELGGAMRLQERLSPQQIWTSVEHRIRLLRAAGEVISDNPLVGVGLGNEPIALVWKGVGLTESHNDIVTSAVTTGIPGVLCFVAFLALWGIGLWRLPGGIVRSSLLALYVALLVTGLANPSFTVKIFWLSAGISAVAMVTLGRRQEMQRSDRQPAFSQAP